METQLAGIAMVPLIIGLVEVGKRLGVDTRWAAPLAVALGVAIGLGYHLAASQPGAAAWAEALLGGLALGLSAAGLYSGAKKLREDATTG